MHGTGKKVTDQESEKSGSSKIRGGSQTIAALWFKKGSKISNSKVHKAKSHVKKIRSTLLKRKGAGSSSKVARNDGSSCRKGNNKAILHKTHKKKSTKKQDPVKVQENDLRGNSDGNEENVKKDVKIRKLRKKRKRQKDKVELDEASRLQRRTRYLLIKMKLEQNLIDAYSGEGWKGQSREKIRPEKELLRAKKQILKCKLGIRDAIHQLDLLSSVGSIEDSVIASDGSVHHEHIFCAKCKLREAFPDNDIVLCDGTCNRAFHQKCLDPPLDTENIPPGEQGWFCKFCECKMEIIEAMNAHIGTHFSVDSNWQDIFKEEAAFPDGSVTLLNTEEEWPSDDSEDDDYDPERRENSHGSSGAGTDNDASDDTGSSTSLSWSFDGEVFSGSGRCERKGLDFENHSADSGVVSDETSDGEVLCGRRRRSAVDYKKLYDEMFGKDAPPYEQVSEDEDWGPGRRKRREKESDAVNTLMTLYESETKCSNVEIEEVREELPSDPKSRRPIFRLPPAAVEKLRQVFAENELPSRTIRESLSQELGLEPEKVNKWFKNARYLALKSRKVGGTKQLHSSATPSKSGLEAGKTQTADAKALEDASQETVLHAPMTPEKIRKSPQPFESTLKTNTNNGDSPANSNKEFGDDVILKKLLKAKKREKKKKRVNLVARDGLQEYEAEMERLCKAKLRLENMKQTLLRHGVGKTKKLHKRHLLHQESVIYVPIAELKEKV
ncbi:hypothetical protein SLE2022_273540 [Rubroshorea leprosula]